MNQHFDVAVVGAGLTGLAAAYSAQREGADVVIIEASNRPGGVVATKLINGFLIEEGPNSLSASDELLALLRAIGLSDEIIEPPASSHRRFIVRNNVLHALPTSPSALISSKLLSATGKFRALCEPLVPRSQNDGDESLASLVRRRFGQEVLDYFVDPFVSGVYAGNPEQLSSRYALRSLGELERRHGSVLVGAARQARARNGLKPQSRIVSLKNGLEQLTKKLAEQLNHAPLLQNRVTEITNNGNGWTLQCEGDSYSQQLTASTVVIAAPSHALDAMILPVNVRELMRPISEVKYAPVATVSFGYRRDQVQHALDGFGVLIPSAEKRGILGTLFSSSMFPDRAPHDHVLLTCFVGGARAERVPTPSHALASALSEIVPLLGIRGSPTFSHVAVWQRGIPQFAPGHNAVVQAAATIETRAPGLLFDGSYRSGVALGECVMNGIATGARAALLCGSTVTF
ncbi:MAG: protoporphyrinogen oxidase [Gemmatimonadaceae bacterium]